MGQVVWINGRLTFEITNKPFKYKAWTYLNPTIDASLTNEICTYLADLRGRMIYKLSVRMRQATVQDVTNKRTFESNRRHAKLSEYGLSERFGVWPKRAKATLKVSTQSGIHYAILTTYRRYWSDRYYEVKILCGNFDTNTLWSKVRSLQGHIATQLYSHKCGFTAPYQLDMENGERFGKLLYNFIS